jgi:multidrug transporter EmrE-like cation transporter
MTPAEKYFQGEKSESLLFVLAGLAALGVAVAFIWKLKQPFYVGMAYPLTAIALVQIAVGGAIYLRTPKDLARVVSMLQKESEKIQTEEIPRMQAVMNNFTIYRRIEIFLFILGILIYTLVPDRLLWRGIGTGLSLQSAFMWVFDFIAARRAQAYLESLGRTSGTSF